MPFCVGLTGGIGSGKSSAARISAPLGAGIVDVDDISHAVTRSGGVAINEIRIQFGAAAIAPDGSLNCSRMRELVFADASAKTKLEAILHPLIGEETRSEVARTPQPYVILMAPLLLERDAYRDLVRRVAVVDCPEAIQIERTMRRSALSADAVRAIMASQLSRADRLTEADDVLHNNSDQVQLPQQVASLHARYLELAASHTANKH